MQSHPQMVVLFNFIRIWLIYWVQNNIFLARFAFSFIFYVELPTLINKNNFFKLKNRLYYGRH